MAQAQALLGRSKPAAATPTTIYTSTGLKTMLVTLTCCNTDAAVADTIAVWIVPSGGSAGDTNAVVKNLVVAFGDTYIFSAPVVLASGDFIVVQSANGDVAFAASGMTDVPASQALLARNQTPAGVPTSIYTSPALTKSMVVTLICCNVDAAADDSVTVWFIPSGGAAVDANAVLKNLVIDFGDPYVMNAPFVLEAGDSIAVLSANGDVTYTVSGMTIS